ncbi:hypothetical protein EDB89DRAFT_1914442 [Lactarius sanguifluus]|nr:hypothetical protein EDB89DRAFT_1914442 [Lactarius sanguifluus]
MLSGGHVINVAAVGLGSQVVEVGGSGCRPGGWSHERRGVRGDVVAAVVEMGSAVPRVGVGGGCGGGSVEGVAMGVKAAVAGITGCATYCVFTQGAASLGGATGVGGSGCDGNWGDLYAHEGRRG